MKSRCHLLLIVSAVVCGQAQDSSGLNPALINMGRTPPDYPSPYEPSSVDQIRNSLDRVLVYLETASPIRVVQSETGETVADLERLPESVTLERGDFSIVSYEWGVTYAGMLSAAEAAGPETSLLPMRPLMPLVVLVTVDANELSAGT